MIGSAQELVDDWFAELGTPTVIVDTAARMLVLSTHPIQLLDGVRRTGLIDRGRRGIAAYDWLVAHVDRGVTVVHTPPNADLDLFARTIVPMYARGIIVAYVMIIDPDRRVTAEFIERWQPVISVTALEILHDRSESLRRRTALSALFGSDEDDRNQAADALLASYSFGRRAVRVAVAALGRDRDSIVVDSRWDLTGTTAVVATLERDLVALVPDDDTIVAGFCDLVERVGMPDHHSRIGIGGRVDHLEQAYLSYRQGRMALNAAPMLRHSEDVVRWDCLGSWRALLMLRPYDAAGAIDPRASAMMTTEDGDTIALVRDYLDREGDVTSLAADRHLHRTTVYGRLKRLGAVYSVDWGSAEDRMAILMGFRIAMLHNLDGAPPRP